MNKYEKYKPSDVAWIGEIPCHWKTMRIKYYCHTISSGATPSTNNASFWDGDIPWIPSGCCHDCEIITAPKYITKEGLNSCSTQIIPAGTTVMAMTGATCSQVGYLTIDASTNQSVMSYIENKKIAFSKFLFYLLIAAREYVLTHQTGGAQAGIDGQDCSNLIVPLVPKDEQIAIAQYLDIKCADIDKAIATQQKRIILLNELRQNVIYKLLTKGIDSSCALKETKISSVGKIPSHWEIRKIKWILKKGKDGIKIGPFGSSLTGKVDSSYDYKVYGQWNIIASNFSAGQSYVSEDTFKELQGYEVKPSDILISMMGTVGKCSVVPDNIEQGIMDSHVVKIRLDERICNSQFFEFVYDKDYSQIVKSQIDRVKKGSIMDGLNSSLIKELFVPVPPIQEQTAIVHEIKKQIEPIDQKIQSSQSQINLLSKYRKSLIYEAVTGKFHV